MARAGVVQLVPALLLGGLSACSGAAPPEPMDPSEIAPEVTEQTPDRFYADTPASPSTRSRSEPAIWLGLLLGLLGYGKNAGNRISVSGADP